MDWTKIRFFKPSEFNCADKMNPDLITALDKLRELADRPIIIHSSYREGDPRQHGMGNAVDIHIVGLHVMDQFFLAEKTGLFNGIGVYSHWNNPGLHLDVRPLREGQPKARWACNRTNNYIGLNWFFLKKLFENQ